MEQPKYVKKKLVTVRCNTPFSYRKIPFAGICNKVILEVEAINYAIMHKARVVEHLRNGQELPLGFDNYNTYNGPTLIDDEADVFDYSEPEVEMVDNQGNSTVINKKKQAIVEDVQYVDLEAEKIKKQKENEKRKILEIQKQKQEEIEKREREKQESLARQKKEKEDAAAKILEQVKSEKKNNSDITTKESISIDFPGSVNPKSDFTNSDFQESKKTFYDGNKKDKRK